MSKRTVYTLIATLLAVFLSFAASGCGEGNAQAGVSGVTAEPSASTEVTAVHTDPPQTPSQTPSATSPVSEAPLSSPVPSPSATVCIPVPSARPSSAEPAEQSPADADFFDDAAFFGNSLMQGLGEFGGLESGDFYAATSASVYSVETTHCMEGEDGEKLTLFDALTERQYGKIYVLLGINEIGFEPDYFAKLYSGLISRIAQKEPDAQIYLCGLTPVTHTLSAQSDVFNMERVQAYNEAIMTIAEQNGYYYMDLCSVLQGEDGYLADRESTDGIHFNPDMYPLWVNYMRTHYAA